MLTVTGAIVGVADGADEGTKVGTRVGATVGIMVGENVSGEACCPAPRIDASSTTSAPSCRARELLASLGPTNLPDELRISMPSCICVKDREW